jgi:hypothetical protein
METEELKPEESMTPLRVYETALSRGLKFYRIDKGDIGVNGPPKRSKS